MKWTEGIIAGAIARQTLASKCVVLVDRCVWTGYECDVLAVTTDLRVIDVEVKISRADLKADAKKDKWWHAYNWRLHGHVTNWKDRPRERREWPPKVWKHYYALPADIWKPELIDTLPSIRSGVILLREQRHGAIAVAEVVRRATPNKDAARITPEDVMDIARLANLRMWDAYKEMNRATSREGQPA